MVIQLSVQCRLNSDFGEHLPKLIEVGFGFNILRSGLCQVVYFIVVHLSILPCLGLMIDSYTDFFTGSSDLVRGSF